jgi:hypothetical protein
MWPNIFHAAHVKYERREQSHSCRIAVKLVSGPLQQFRQLRNIGRDPPRFVLENQFEKSEAKKAYPRHVEDHCKS